MLNVLFLFIHQGFEAGYMVLSLYEENTIAEKPQFSGGGLPAVAIRRALLQAGIIIVRINRCTNSRDQKEVYAAGKVL